MPLWSQGGARGGTGFQVSVNGLTELQKAMRKIEGGLKSPANKYMRNAAAEIAELDLMPEMRRTAAATPTGLASAFAAGMKAKKDRLISVRVATVPKGRVRGLQRGIGDKKATKKFKYSSTQKNKEFGGYMKARRLATTSNYTTTLAWGSEMGPYGADTVDTYAMPRRPSGYWVQPAIRNTLPDLRRRYKTALDNMIARYTGPARLRNAMTDLGG